MIKMVSSSCSGKDWNLVEIGDVVKFKYCGDEYIGLVVYSPEGFGLVSLTNARCTWRTVYVGIVNNPLVLLEILESCVFEYKRGDLK